MNNKPKSFFIVVNPPGSKFAKALQCALQNKVVNKVWRRRTPKVDRHGRSLPHFKVTEHPLNKVDQFERFLQAGVASPRFATSADAAKQLDCKSLFARTLINSTNGRGIIEFESSSSDYPRAPLYTEYIPKRAEYRFHVFGDKVIDIQQKKKAREFNEDNRNVRIRNLNNGYVYCRTDVNPPDGAADLAINAVKALGYAYGAVDLIYNEKRNQCYVLEVNSRPGLMGTTLDRYADALIEMYNLTRK